MLSERADRPVSIASNRPSSDILRSLILQRFTTQTPGLLIWGFVAAACSNYERFQETMSHTFLYIAPGMNSLRLRRLDKLFEYLFYFYLCYLDFSPVDMLVPWRMQQSHCLVSRPDPCPAHRTCHFQRSRHCTHRRIPLRGLRVPHTWSLDHTPSLRLRKAQLGLCQYSYMIIYSRSAERIDSVFFHYIFHTTVIPSFKLV